MTTAQRWPKNAEAARMESLAAARDIIDLGTRAKSAVRENKRDLALAILAEIQLAAKDIELRLCLIK